MDLSVSAAPLSRSLSQGLCRHGRLTDARCLRRAPHKRHQTLQGLRVQAQGQTPKAPGEAANGALGLLKQIASSKAYKWGFEGAIAVGLFMLVDAAYSGDWSRIGAISKELEAQLKGIAPLVGGFHLFCAPVAAVVASKRGLSTPKAVAKTLLIGGPALFEIVLSDTTD